MELNFTFQNGFWIAETEVNNHFNVHVECESLSNIKIKQRTSGNMFAMTEKYDRVYVVDDDFLLAVPPKKVQVICNKKPIMCEIKEASL